MEADVGQIDGFHTEDAECGDGIEAECAACAEGANAFLIKGKDCLIGEAVEGFDVRLGDAAVTCKATDTRRLGGIGCEGGVVHAQSFRVRRFRHAECRRCDHLSL